MHATRTEAMSQPPKYFQRPPLQVGTYSIYSVGCDTCPASRVNVKEIEVVLINYGMLNLQYWKCCSRCPPQTVSKQCKLWPTFWGGASGVYLPIGAGLSTYSDSTKCMQPNNNQTFSVLELPLSIWTFVHGIYAFWAQQGNYPTHIPVSAMSFLRLAKLNSAVLHDICAWWQGILVKQNLTLTLNLNEHGFLLGCSNFSLGVWTVIRRMDTFFGLNEFWIGCMHSD